MAQEVCHPHRKCMCAQGHRPAPFVSNCRGRAEKLVSRGCGLSSHPTDCAGDGVHAQPAPLRAPLAPDTELKLLAGVAGLTRHRLLTAEWPEGVNGMRLQLAVLVTDKQKRKLTVHYSRSAVQLKLPS